MYLLLLILVLILGLWTPTGDCTSGTVDVKNRKYVRIKAPKVVDPTDEKIVLECNYSLGDDGLYSVSWFKDGNEFFRYMPPTYSESGDEPHCRVFDVHGIRVDTSASNDTRVVIYQYYGGKWVNITGWYGCQVSGEGPKFDVIYYEANVTVGVLYAYSDPVLKGIKSHYNIGDTLTATCTSSPVYPPAQLAFFVNGHQVKNSSRIKLIHLDNEKPTQIDDPNVIRTSMELSLTLERSDFNARDGSLSLVCQSHIPGITSVEPRETKTIVSLYPVTSAQAVSNNERQHAASDAVEPTNIFSSSSASSRLLSAVTITNKYNIILAILMSNFSIFNNHFCIFSYKFISLL